MVSSSPGNWTVRGVTLLVWAAAAASVAYWGLRLSSEAATGPTVVPAARQAGPVDPAVVARLLGHSNTVAAGPAAPAAAPMSSRFNLVGVVADRSQHGAALIAVDGRPAKPFRVGSRVDEGLVLQSVQPRRAVLAASLEGPAVVMLDMPVQQR